MNLPAPPTGLHPEDYDRIEAAVMETVRGRWFLLEYARRQRAGETERLVHAVDRLERYVAARAGEVEAPEREAAAGEWRLPRRLAERAREFAETLRASGVDEKLCAQADALADQFAAYAEPPPSLAPEVIAAPSAEAPAAEPVAPAAQTASEETASEETASEQTAPEQIAFEEAEWSEPEPMAAQEDEAAAEAVDLRKWEEEAVADAAEEAIIVDPRHAALSRLDHLSLHEKLRLFG